MDRTIFIAIAAYTDPELPRTLRDCLEQAKRPGTLRFGICWQGDDSRPVDLDAFRGDSRFRFRDFDVAESQGGPWARNIAQGLWDGEPYTLQVDSHMKFEPEWDARLLAMFDALPSDNPLITVNCPLFWYDEQGALHRRFDMGVPTTRLGGWEASAGYSPWFVFGPPPASHPARSRFVNGNFAFARGRWNLEVPQDPEHYYWGEEFNITVRSYTWGYDFFLPGDVVAWHLCHFDGGPRRHWEKGEAVVARRNAVAFERLRRLVYSDGGYELGEYGLGRVRSLSEYEVFAGLDLRGKRAHPDVYTGRPPDPVTIKQPSDWHACLSFAEAEARGLTADHSS